MSKNLPPAGYGGAHWYLSTYETEMGGSETQVYPQLQSLRLSWVTQDLVSKLEQKQNNKKLKSTEGWQAHDELLATTDPTPFPNS